MAMPLKDMTGERYGKLVVISKANDPRHGTRWLCRCDCGKEKIVQRRHLINGTTKSCGCSKSEFVSSARTTHGMRKTRLYRIWTGVKDRCLNTNSKYWRRYGGRGIRICDEWKDSFESFRDWALVNGYSDKLTLDRTNNDGNYCPENCRWVGYIVQANNRENSIKLEIDGVSKTYTEWADTFGVDKKLFSSRMRKGWDVADAIIEKRHEAKTYECNGEKHTSAEWAEIKGYKNKRLVYIRVEKFGWNIEKAVTTPPREQRLRRK